MGALLWGPGASVVNPGTEKTLWNVYLNQVFISTKTTTQHKKISQT